MTILSFSVSCRSNPVRPLFIWERSGNISVVLLCRVRKLSDFIKNILICVLKMNEGLTGLELHEGELLMKYFLFLVELSLKGVFAGIDVGVYRIEGGER